MPAYAEQSDVVNIFGAKNVVKWASLDNDATAPDDDEVTARVTWAANLATAFIDSTLLGGPYVTPFTSTPDLILDACARMAGVYLYESRGIVDTDGNGNPIHSLSAHRDMVAALLEEIKTGKRRLPGVSGSVTYPVVKRNQNYQDSVVDRYSANGLPDSWFPAPSITRPTIWNEIPVGAVDGVNRVFTLVHTPYANHLQLSRSGIDQRPGAGYDYQLTGNVITFEPGNAPVINSNLLAIYEYNV